MTADMRSPSRKKKNSASSMSAPLTRLSSTLRAMAPVWPAICCDTQLAAPRSSCGTSRFSESTIGDASRFDQQPQSRRAQVLQQPGQLAGLHQAADLLVGAAASLTSIVPSTIDGMIARARTARTRTDAARERDPRKARTSQVVSGIEGERQDGRPAERAGKRRQEQEELVEEERQDDEEEGREQPLARHGRTVATCAGGYKAIPRLDTEGARWYQMAPYRALTQARSSVARALP